MPCPDTCQIAPVRSGDRDVIAVAPHFSPARIDVALFSLPRAEATVAGPIVHARDLNASPPYGGSPPQAYLQLWLI